MRLADPITLVESVAAAASHLQLLIQAGHFHSCDLCSCVPIPGSPLKPQIGLATRHLRKCIQLPGHSDQLLSCSRSSQTCGASDLRSAWCAASGRQHSDGWRSHLCLFVSCQLVARSILVNADKIGDLHEHCSGECRWRQVDSMPVPAFMYQYASTSIQVYLDLMNRGTE